MRGRPRFLGSAVGFLQPLRFNSRQIVLGSPAQDSPGSACAFPCSSACCSFPAQHFIFR